MKHFLLILFLCFSMLCSAQHIITKMGVDDIRLNKSVLKDVQKAFPNGKVIKDSTGGDTGKASARLTDGSSIRMKMYEPKQVKIDYICEEEGIAFHFGYNSNVVEYIDIWGKNGFKTDTGIVPGKSTFHDVDLIYGTKEWQYILSDHLGVYVWTRIAAPFYFNSDDKTKVKQSDSIIVNEIQL
jgi:hypothetical protein